MEEESSRRVNLLRYIPSVGYSSSAEGGGLDPWVPPPPPSGRGRVNAHEEETKPAARSRVTDARRHRHTSRAQPVPETHTRNQHEGDRSHPGRTVREPDRDQGRKQTGSPRAEPPLGSTAAGQWGSDQSRSKFTPELCLTDTVRYFTLTLFRGKYNSSYFTLVTRYFTDHMLQFENDFLNLQLVTKKFQSSEKCRILIHSKHQRM